MPHTTVVAKDGDTPKRKGRGEHAPAASKHVETRPFPYGIKDSVIPPPPEAQMTDGADLPLGARPADPSLPPRPDPEARPPRPGRSPLSDPSMPEALRDSTAPLIGPDEDGPIAPAQLPQGIQEDFDAMLREIDEQTAERPVAAAAGASVRDPQLDAFDEARTHVSAPPAQQLNASPERSGMESFSEDSSTVVTPEAPRYQLPDVHGGSGKKVFVTLSLLFFLALAGAAAYLHYSGKGIPYFGKPGRSAATNNAAPQERSPSKHASSPLPSTAVIAADARAQSGTDAGIRDASTVTDAATTALGDAATKGDQVAGSSGVDLPEVPESIARLPEKRRVREARKQLRLGNRLIRRKRFDSALWHYDRALTFDPRFAAAARGKARILLEMKRADAALAWAIYSVELEDDSEHAWLTLGGVREALDQSEEAVMAYEKALQLAPRSRSAKRALARLRP